MVIRTVPSLYPGRQLRGHGTEEASDTFCTLWRYKSLPVPGIELWQSRACGVTQAVNYRRVRCAEHVGRVEEIKKCLDSYGERICLKTSTLKTKKEM